MKLIKFNKVLSLLDKDQKKSGLLLISLMFIASIAELFGLGFVILIINSFLSIQNNFSIPFISSLNANLNSINSLLIILSVIFTVKYLLLILVVLLESSFIAKFRERISFKMFKNFLNRDSSALLKKNSAEYLRNFTEEINQNVLFYHSLVKITLDLILFCLFVIFLIAYNPITSISAIVFFSIISLIYFILIKNKISRWSRAALENKKKRIQFVNESFSAIKFIKILSSENFFLKKFKIHNFSLSNILYKMSFINALPRHTYEYILFLSIVLLIFFVSKELGKDQIIQMLSIYTLASFRIIPMINRLLTNSQNLRFAHPSFEKLYIEQNYPVVEKNVNPPIFKFDKKLKILIKKFNYDNKNKVLLKNINLNINKNNKIGIIGPSGSGKSTIIDIICGFQKLNHGVIESDGKSIFSNLEGWQKNIGYIPQNIVILNQSLKENILFGSNPKLFSDRRISKILRKVNLEYFLKKLPNGLNQIIRQDGQNISGGEIQRIGIARALLNNPNIIILDEATSGLDTFTESKVLDTINKIKKTVIIVSHRINTLKFCDKVYSIDKSTLKLINKLS
jgi:ABC-type multidrug transport system fused ATPase/permease subunit